MLNKRNGWIYLASNTVAPTLVGGGLVTHWDFEDAGPIFDKAPEGAQADALTLSGTAALSDFAFDGGQSLMFVDENSPVTVPDSQDINLGIKSTLSVSFSFFANSSSDGRRQVLYEQGGTARGLNAYLHNGQLYAGAWNLLPARVDGMAHGSTFRLSPIGGIM